MDTRVTNHGYRGGAATDYQAVLQTGTAVLVDGHGVPRVRCACGNPLTPAVAQRTVPRRTGDTWASYRSQNVVVVLPATTTIDVFVIYDPKPTNGSAVTGATPTAAGTRRRTPGEAVPAVSVSSASPKPPASKSPASESPYPSDPSSSDASSSDVSSPSTSSSSDPEYPSSEPATTADTSSSYDAPESALTPPGY